MSLWITETEPKVKHNIKQSLTNCFYHLINKILQLLKSKAVQSTYIQKLQKNIIDLNGFKTTIEITSVYRSLFKINLSLQIVFIIHLQISVKYTITPIDFSMVQKLPLLGNLNYVLREIQKNPYRNIIIRLQNSVKVEQLLNYQFEPSYINRYAQITANYLSQTYHLCQAMIEDLQREFWNSKCSGQKQSIANFFKAYKGLAMIEKENQNFRKFYQNQNNGVSFLANPEEIEEKPYQILRELQFEGNYKRKQVKISSLQSERFIGGLSRISQVQIYGSTIDTYFHHRQFRGNEEQDSEYKPQNEMGERKYQLICKRTCDNDDSRNSMNNEMNYLKLKGGLKIAYICSYFLLSNKEAVKTKGKTSSKNKQNQQQKQQKELYSQYHEQRIFEKFHRNREFTLLDIMNFGQQLITALIEFYLNLGYLYRDMKQENVLLDRKGVIQIIDHGSVYPYKRETLNPLIEEQRKLFDSKLRSTIYCKKQIFSQDPFLKAKYKHYLTYRDINSTHITFDVYSVGFILDQLLTSYESSKYPKWMQVSQRLRTLTKKMAQRDFQLRIQMQTALEELKSIRRFIFTPQN